MPATTGDLGVGEEKLVACITSRSSTIPHVLPLPTKTHRYVLYCTVLYCTVHPVHRSVEVASHRRCVCATKQVCKHGSTDGTHDSRSLPMPCHAMPWPATDRSRLLLLLLLTAPPLPPIPGPSSSIPRSPDIPSRHP